MTEDTLIGKQFGEYRIEALLGQGGMARVYRALDVRLKRQAVIKIIDPPARNDPGYVTRFEREAQIIGRLDHPHIVRLYRFDEQDGWLYMAMQYIEGADLGAILAGYRTDQELMDSNDARRVIREICTALDYAHRQGVIHRDVKPANILLDREGRALLSDFGLALITEIGTRGEIFGSAHYIAPEQAVSSAKAVPQSDLYAIGVILYEMFTGDVPFKAATPLEIALLHISEPPEPPRQRRPDLHPELEAVILKALAKKTEDRYPTGAALADALDSALDAHSATTVLTSPSSTSRSTIPERVALEVGLQPLPPIPAVLAFAPVERLVPAEPITPPVRRKPLTSPSTLAALGALFVLALVCFALVVLPPMLNRFRAGGTQQAGQTPATEAAQLDDPPTELAATLFATPIAFVEPSTTLPAPLMATGSPTALPPTPVSYQLLIVRGKSNDSIIIINQSENVFPLELLRLESDEQVVNGTEWGVANLESGACVGVRKETRGNAKNKPPDDLNCKWVDNWLFRDKKDWLGESSFVINYDREEFGDCDEDQNECLITIVP